MSGSGPQVVKGASMDGANIGFSAVKVNSVGGKNARIHYNGNKSMLYISTPLMTTWGVNEYVDEKTGRKSYDMSLQFPNAEYMNDDQRAFLDGMIAYEEKIKNAATTSCSKEWFNKAKMSAEVVDALWTPMVRYPKDKETGEPDGKYPDTFQFKILQYDNVVKCGCFDGEKNAMNVSEPDKENYVVLGINIPWSESATTPHVGIFKKGTQVKAVLRCKGIWITNGNFGCGWEAEQIRIKPQPTFDDYAFLDDSEQEEDEEEGRETMEGNFVNSSSDDSDEEEGGLSRQVSKSK